MSYDTLWYDAVSYDEMVPYFIYILMRLSWKFDISSKLYDADVLVPISMID